MSTNSDIAELLRRVAAVFRVLEGDTFRVKAYNNAAVSIENFAVPLSELARKGELDEVPGVGASLSGYLSEYFRKGKVRHFEAKFRKVPAGMFPLMDLRGVGPMTAYKIAKKFRLNDSKTALKELKKLISEGKLDQIASFKEKSIKRLSQSLETNSTGQSRMLLSEAMSIADKFLAYLKDSSHIIDAVPLGSLRRRLSTIGDLDLAICTSNSAKAQEYARKYPDIATIITQGKDLSHVKLKNGYEVDIKSSSLDEWGALLQHYTGSKLHNIKLRTYALSKNLSLSEHGIKKGKKLFQFQSEKDFYEFLGLSYIIPEMREDKGEIEISLKHKLPKLIEEKDIKGDLHVHSNFDFPSSHDLGDTSLNELLEKAQSLDYEYLGISDHNPKFLGLSMKEKSKILIARRNFLTKAYDLFKKRNPDSNLKILLGLEIDIRPDGSLALADALLDSLDYAIVSIHSSFNHSEADNTKRILSALSHPKAVILGHPTTRMLNHREPIVANWAEIIDYCVANHKIIEINASPARLDFPDDLTRLAVEKKAQLIINTDSHDVSQMDFMKYGVWQARRGWAQKSDICNTFSYSDLHRVINYK